MTAQGRAPCDEAFIRAAAPAAPACPQRARPWVLATSIIGSSMAFIDGSVVTVALPAMQGGLDASMSSVHSATSAGAAFLPLTLVMGLLSRWSGGLVAGYGARTPLIAGPCVAGVGLALFAVPAIGGSYWTTFLLPMALLGFGMAISVAPLTTTVMTAVDDRHAGTASGINNAVSRVAGLLAVALLGAVAVGVFRAALETRLDALPLASSVRATLLAQAPDLARARVPPELGGWARQTVEFALDAAFLLGFRVAMLVAAGLAFASALCAAWTIRADPRHRA